MPNSSEHLFDENGMVPGCLNPHSGRCDNNCIKLGPTDICMGFENLRYGKWWALAAKLRLPLKTRVRHMTVTRATGRMIPSGEAFQVSKALPDGFILKMPADDEPFMCEERVVIRQWEEYVR